MKIGYTQVWKVNGHLVVASTIEDAIAVYKKYCDGFEIDDNIERIEVVWGREVNDTMAIIDEDYYKDNKDDKGRITG